MSFKKRYAALLLTVFAVAYNVAFFKESYVQFKRRSLNELPFPINFQDESIGKESFWKIDDITYQVQPPCLPGIFTYYIKSHHTKGFQRREHIRKTWGRDRSIIFILLNTEPFIKAQEGTFQPPADIEEEDLLIANGYDENLDNFSIKIAIAVNHASKCQSHMIITDDDVFIWTDDLESSVIHAGWTLTDTVEIKGRCKQKELPVRDQEGEWGKYYISMSDYPFELYPPYCSGAGYITSLQAIKRIREQIPYTILVPHVDDVYFGMLAYDAGVNVIHDSRFTTSAEKKWIPCDLFNFHGYNISDGFVKRDYPKNECTIKNKEKIFL